MDREDVLHMCISAYTQLSQIRISEGLGKDHENIDSIDLKTILTVFSTIQSQFSDFFFTSKGLMQ